MAGLVKPLAPVDQPAKPMTVFERYFSSPTAKLPTMHAHIKPVKRR